ncbi:MAG: PaaI family thioesterase [Lentimicrobiaceae bacterium]|jgi:acyl-coenzyme A thioesterase PaaI-like protein|nr:PaaI family thioesterase [Lentimicrobiaceae bacterium]
MRKIINPFVKQPGYNCFGCSPDNPLGLKMEFAEEGDNIVSRWKAQSDYQGWNGVLHGGIQQTLMDEIASWVVFTKLKTGGVTSRMESRFKKAVQVASGDIITLHARHINTRHNLAYIHVQLFDNQMQLCTEADVQYFTFPEKAAKTLLNYPGYHSFFEIS